MFGYKMSDFVADAQVVGVYLAIILVISAGLIWGHNRVKARSTRVQNAFYFLSVLVICATSWLFGRATGDDQALVFGLIVSTGFPIFYFFLETKFSEAATSRHGLRIEIEAKLEGMQVGIEGLTYPPKSVASNRRLVKDVRGPVSDALHYLYENEKTINELVSGTTEEDNTFGRISVAAIASQFQASFFDLLKHDKLNLKSEVFAPTWMRLTDESASYLSVCDLSAYNRIWAQDLDDDLEDWTFRLDTEIAHLNSLPSDRLRGFDKIIVYEERSFITPAKEKPACQDGGLCAGRSCQTPCIVKEVSRRWIESGLDLKFKSHAPESSPTGGNVWLVERSGFADLFAHINERKAANKARITSLDIGLFGNSIVGEEFKLHGQAFNSVAGVPDTIPPSTSSRKRSFDYVYTMRRDRELHASLKYRLTQEMRPQGRLICAT